MDPQRAWNELTTHLREVEILGQVSMLAGWDQQTMMPPKGAEARGEQLSLLSRLAHGRMTDERVDGWLQVLEASELDSVKSAAVRKIRRTYDRNARLSAELVGEIARAEAEGFDTWIKAKETSDFALFQPALSHTLDLMRAKAAAIDSENHPYDVLLADFDPGVTVEGLRVTFARLRDGLTELIGAIGERPQLPDLGLSFDLAGQEALNREVSAALGYDYQAGRLDPAEHPFSSSPGGPGDSRLTTHLHEHNVLDGLSSTIHEAGHGMYEQGLPTQWPGTLLGEAASFGLHESQSRFWENAIGRSQAFCEWLAPIGKKHLGASFPEARALYEASNRVQPSLIRVQADEVTYNLHIIVRFEIELALFEGRLDVVDLPEAWNARYREYLGIEPPDDARGVLQDVHWSGGSFAYFPSYTLGNLYAASLQAGMEAQLPAMWEDVRRGDFSEILAWMRDRIHRHGHTMEAPELVRRAVGERDSVQDLLDRLWARQGKVYGIARG